MRVIVASAGNAGFAQAWWSGRAGEGSPRAPLKSDGESGAFSHGMRHRAQPVRMPVARTSRGGGL